MKCFAYVATTKPTVRAVPKDELPNGIVAFERAIDSVHIARREPLKHSRIEPEVSDLQSEQLIASASLRNRVVALAPRSPKLRRFDEQTLTRPLQTLGLQILDVCLGCSNHFFVVRLIRSFASDHGSRMVSDNSCCSHNVASSAP